MGDILSSLPAMAIWQAGPPSGGWRRSLSPTLLPALLLRCGYMLTRDGSEGDKR
jgi:hypothetical protein